MESKKRDPESKFLDKKDFKESFIVILKFLGFFTLGFIIAYFIGYSSFTKPVCSPFIHPNHHFVNKSVVISVYNPVPSQTDSNPLITFCGDTISVKDSTSQKWAAISPDLFRDLNLMCGDSVKVYCGECPYEGRVLRVTDKTHDKISGRIDILEHGSICTGLYTGYISIIPHKITITDTTKVD